MNLVQFEYLKAIDVYKSFSKAAEALYITQPALTIQIKNLEEELGVVLIDRKKKPVILTEIGERILHQAEVILSEIKRVKEIVSDFKEELKGELKLGIIPTVAPYLVPKFINNFSKKYPEVKLEILEEKTEIITGMLKDNMLDCGIISTPIKDQSYIVNKLYDEKFLLYVSGKNELISNKNVSIKKVLSQNIFLLSEGNCFRNQVLNICDIKGNYERFSYQSASIDSIIRLLKTNNGVTFIPEMAAKELNEKNIKEISDSKSYREISLITTRHFLKQNIIQKLVEEIKKSVPKSMQSNARKKIIDTNI